MGVELRRFIERWLIPKTLLQNPLVRRILKNSSYLLGATGTSAGISMLQGILTARLLGVAGFGVLGAVIMFTSVINRFASFRMSELVVRYVGQYTEAGDPRRAAAVFKAAALAEMLASIVAFVLIVLFSPLAARYLAKDPSLAVWFAVYGLIVLANLIAESSTGLLQIFDRFRHMAGLNMLQSVVTLLLIFIVFLAQGGLPGVLLAYVGGKVIGAGGITGIAIGEASRQWGRGWWRAPLSVLRPQGRELAHFAVSTNISSTLSLINKDSEILWISLFRGPVETGYYKLALSLANMVQMPVSPLPTATYPELARQVSHSNWDGVRSILRQGTQLAGAYSLLATLGLVVLGRPLIGLLYTPEFLPSYPALVILLVGLLVANTFYWHRAALLALGYPGFPTRVNLYLALGKVLGILLLVPRFGYLMNAALLSASYVVGVSVSALKVRSIIRQRSQEAGI